MAGMIQPDDLIVTDEPPTPPLGFEEFFEAQYERLCRALYLVTGDPVEAEDVAQEALVRLYERWERVRSLDSSAGYLFRTALNLHRSRLRRLAVRARSLVSPEPPVDPALAAEARDELGRALASLPDGQREALVLVEWVGMDAEDAGRVLGIEAVSVRVRVSRARAVLRERFERERHG